jgi:DNA (cytosine-5)-methyltransferase 1
LGLLNTTVNFLSPRRKPQKHFMPSTYFQAIDLFCGGGGMTCGLQQVGISVVAGVDNDPTCREAFELNNPTSKFLLQDIRTVKSTTLAEYFNGFGPKILAGCAPCQPFSNYRQARQDEGDPREGLLGEFMRITGRIRPEYVVMENVPKLAETPVFLLFLQALEGWGYSYTHQVVKCEEFGVPQARRRLVLLAYKGSSTPSLERPSETRRTVRDAIGHLPRLAAGQQNKSDSLHRAASLSPLNLLRIKHSKPGGTWRDWPEHLLSECHRSERGGGYTPVYGRMSWDDSAPTITTQCYNYGSGRYGHPSQDRPISLREAALLQGFPANYVFWGKNSPLPVRDAAKVIGNAVPPPLAQVIGRTIIKHYLETPHGKSSQNKKKPALCA